VAAAAALAFGGLTADARPARERVPGAASFKVCAAAGPYWPTMTLALERTSAWIACKEQSRVIRVGTATGRTLDSVRLGAPVIAVAAGYGSVWALDSASTLYRIRPATARVTRRIALAAPAPYNIWIGGGSVWVVADGSGQVVRVSPATNRVLARIEVGDGPADLVFAGARAWVINHRDRGLVRIDPATNEPSRVTTVPGDAPERMALLAGSLWITGREVTTVATAVGRVDVHGLQAAGGFLSLADNRSGFLYRLRT
jgi:DNA-binding beta-propeller fold protein YncE